MFNTAQEPGENLGDNAAGLEDKEVIDIQEDTDEELVITIGDAAPPEDPIAEEEKTAPQWVKDLRKKTKEQERKIRELESKQAQQPAVEQKPTLPTKPTLADDGIDYDAEVFETKLASWYETKRVHDDAIAKEQAAAMSEKEAWNSKLADYAAKKSSIKVPDYDDSEYAVQNALSATQQGILIKCAKNSAHLVYALGKNPEQLKALAAITDPVEYTFALAEIQGKLNVTKRTTAPAPEKRISGGSGGMGSLDSQLEKLRTEAEKTGDYSKVIAYKRSKK